jgi:D-amino-acid dehydrogenase
MREGVNPNEKEVIELGLRSLELYNALFEEEDLKVDLLRGILGLYLDEEDARTLAERSGDRFVDQNEIAEMGFRGMGGGVLAQRELSINPPKLCSELRRRLVEMGVEIRAGKAAFISAEGMIATTNIEGGGKLIADAQVVASGAMSREILGSIGYRPLVLPARGLIRLYDTGAKKLVPYPSLLEDYGIALIQHDASTVRLTSFFEMVGFDEAFSENRKRWLEGTVREHFAGFGDLRFVEEGTGYRPCTPDQAPVIGPVPHFSNLYVATGNCRLGITLAPVTGRIISSMIGGKGAPAFVERLIDPRRFAD